MLSVFFSIPFAKRHMHRVAKTLANLLADVLPQSDDEARCPHLHDLAVVWHTVKSGVDQQTAFAEQCPDVEWHLNIGGIHIAVLKDNGIEFHEFGFVHFALFFLGFDCCNALQASLFPSKAISRANLKVVFGDAKVKVRIAYQ